MLPGPGRSVFLQPLSPPPADPARRRAARSSGRPLAVRRRPRGPLEPPRDGGDHAARALGVPALLPLLRGAVYPARAAGTARPPSGHPTRPRPRRAGPRRLTQPQAVAATRARTGVTQSAYRRERPRTVS